MEKEARLTKFEEDSIIIREGEIQDEMFKILSGNIAVYLNYGKEDEYLLGIYSKGRCFGELGILLHKPSMFTAVAVNQVLLLRIAENELEEFLRNNINNAMDMIQSLAKEVSTLKGNVDMLLEEFTKGTEATNMEAENLKKQMNNLLKEEYAFSMSLIKKESGETLSLSKRRMEEAVDSYLQSKMKQNNGKINKKV